MIKLLHLDLVTLFAQYIFQPDVSLIPDGIERPAATVHRTGKRKVKRDRQRKLHEEAAASKSPDIAIPSEPVTFARRYSR